MNNRKTLWLRLANFRIPLQETAALEDLVARRFRIGRAQLADLRIVRQALDARREDKISFVYTLEAEVPNAGEKWVQRWTADKNVSCLEPIAAERVEPGSEPMQERPVVIGFGPAGMFAALTLARQGYRPLVLERGTDIGQRQADVRRFWDAGILDPDSNVQFGEGGAGTFSDGKLTTRVHDPLMTEVLEALVAAGAPPEIRYWYKPHIGTDRLREVVRNIRREIMELGGEVRFRAQVTDFLQTDGKLAGLIVNQGTRLPCRTALLGIGHSARDTYEMLRRSGVAMEAKPFSVGLRIEHPQGWIDKAQYGGAAGHPRLGPADYSLVFHDRIAGRTAYSFCMCPGGIVIGAASEPGGLVVNGMSHYNRASGAANSALAVNVNPEDFGGDISAGIEFQRRLEQKAFVLGGGNFTAPVQTVGDFLSGQTGSREFLTPPSHGPAVKTADLAECLPEFAVSSLRRALPDFGRKIRGFDHPGAVLTGVETRTSAPLRILRGENRESPGVAGLFPMGEGAGYAGGIMSAAIDGMRTAHEIIRRYSPA